jgi:hypothetical protein
MVSLGLGIVDVGPSTFYRILVIVGCGLAIAGDEDDANEVRFFMVEKPFIASYRSTMYTLSEFVDGNITSGFFKPSTPL